MSKLAASLAVAAITTAMMFATGGSALAQNCQQQCVPGISKQLDDAVDKAKADAKAEVKEVLRDATAVIDDA